MSSLSSYQTKRFHLLLWMLSHTNIFICLHTHNIITVTFKKKQKRQERSLQTLNYKHYITNTTTNSIPSQIPKSKEPMPHSYKHTVFSSATYVHIFANFCSLLLFSSSLHYSFVICLIFSAYIFHLHFWFSCSCVGITVAPTHTHAASTSPSS